MLILLLLCLPASFARKIIFKRPIAVPYAGAFAFVIFVIGAVICRSVFLSETTSAASRLLSCLLPIIPPLYSFFVLAPPDSRPYWLRRMRCGAGKPGNPPRHSRSGAIANCAQ